jgi:transcriptional regulator GlxA family with amidase domain
MTETKIAQGQIGQSSGRLGQALPISVDLLVTERCFASGVALTCDLLETANILTSALGGPTPFFVTKLLSRDGRPVRTSTGTMVSVEGSYADARGTVAMVFGPGMADSQRILSGLELRDTRELVAQLRTRNAEGHTLCASCSSTFLLAEAGALDGKEATTSWWLAPTFRERYPAVRLVESSVVVGAGRVITAGAALAQIDLVLELVRVFESFELSHALSRYLLVERSTTSQTSFVVLSHLAMNDELVLAAERIMRSDLTQPLDIDSLASTLGVSAKTLARRFSTVTGFAPAQFVRRLRLEIAQHLLGSSTDTIAAIAERVGYDDERAFRRAFERDFGVSPARYRKRLSGK